MTEESGFSQEIIAHIPYLQAFARALTRDRDLAEDMVQDTLERALSRQSQFQPGTNLRGWLTIILRNRYFNLLRRRRCRAEAQLDIPFAISGGQEEAVEWRDFLRAFWQLPVGQRKALALVGANGMSYEEAAGIAGCMVGTMKSRASRGRQQLQTMLGRH